MQKLTLSQMQNTLKKYEEKVEKLKSLTTEQLRKYTVKEYMSTLNYNESRVLYYTTAINEKINNTKVNGYQTV